MDELRALLKRGLKLMPDLVDSHCGNSEDTPCDDLRPKYVCKWHRWIADVRRVLAANKKVRRG
jgi:hypothetical protein